jgi:hypothetical protein
MPLSDPLDRRRAKPSRSHPSGVSRRRGRDPGPSYARTRVPSTLEMPLADRWPVPDRTPTEPRRRRRLRFPRPRKVVVLVLAAAVLVGAGAAADRAVARTITSRVSDRLACDLGSTSHSTIELSGPFVLPQLLSGGLRQVDVKVRNLPVNGSAADLDVTLKGVDLGGLFTAEKERTISAGSGTAHAKINYKAVSTLLSQQLGGMGLKLTSHGDALEVSVSGDALKDTLSDALGSASDNSSLISSIGKDLLGSTGGSSQGSSLLDLLGQGVLGSTGGSSQGSSLLDLLGQGALGSTGGSSQGSSLLDLLGQGVLGSTGGSSQGSSLLESIGQNLLDSALSGKTVVVGLVIGVKGGDITIAPRSLRLGDQKISLDALRNLLGNVPEAAELLNDRRVSTSQLPGFIRLTSLDPTSTGLSLAADIGHAELSPKTMGSSTGSTCKP